jgi:PAS domain S-box-containing protein
VAVRRQKSLLLILAREFSSQLAMPTFVVDGEGNLVFYNEAAEPIIGRSFAEVGELDAAELVRTIDIANLEGEVLEPHDRAIGVALFEGRPTHATRRLRAFDGAWHTVEVTAFPLMTGPEEVGGVVAIFWESDGGQ